MSVYTDISHIYLIVPTDKSKFIKNSLHKISLIKGDTVYSLGYLVY